MTLIISADGTILPADTCYLVPETAFNDAEWKLIEDFSDSEIARIGRENGIPVEQCEQLLQSIADALWGEDADEDWSADTLDAISDAIYNQRPDLPTARG